MDLSPDSIRAQLVHVDAHGWECGAGRALLESLRHGIVEPVVRRSGLAGAAADQAVATGWAAAWDAARRPTLRTAENPAGMVWVAVRRAVWAEVVAARPEPWGRDRSSMDLVAQAGAASAAQPGRLGPHLEAIVDELVDLGWDRDTLVAAVEELADQAVPDAAGAARARWRWVALRVGLPDWQARRLASALLGVPAHPGVLALVVTSGSGVLRDEGIRRVLRATCQRTLASPAAHLSSWAASDGTSVWASEPWTGPVPIPASGAGLGSGPGTTGAGTRSGSGSGPAPGSTTPPIQVEVPSGSRIQAGLGDGPPQREGGSAWRRSA